MLILGMYASFYIGVAVTVSHSYTKLSVVCSILTLMLNHMSVALCSAWLWHIARGKNGDEVQGRVLTKSHSCSRAFPGPKALTSMTSVSLTDSISC